MMADDEKIKYDNFFKEIKKFKDNQDKQKQRGLNDYNMVNVVRKENAEVGMHSNVIYSLVDPNGLHYQDDLFLKLFIEEVLTEHKDNFGEILSVDAEESTFDNRRIDFTIKSTQCYIGIEMKIDAKDLKNQLSHYEDDLKIKAQKDKNQDVIIYYLTKDGKEAAPHSKNGITYKQVSFEEHILNWIDRCQQEVKNITNLNEAFENYKTIVHKITNQYKGKVMALEELLKDEQLFLLAKDIKDAYFKALYKRIQSLMHDIDAEMKDKNIKSTRNDLSIDIDINQYFIRILLIKEQITIQIGSKEDYGFKNKIDLEAKKELLKKLKNIHHNFNGGWSNSYGVLTFKEKDLLKEKEINMTINKLLEILK